MEETSKAEYLLSFILPITDDSPVTSEDIERLRGYCTELSRTELVIVDGRSLKDAGDLAAGSANTVFIDGGSGQPYSGLFLIGASKARGTHVVLANEGTLLCDLTPEDSRQAQQEVVDSLENTMESEEEPLDFVFCTDDGRWFANKSLETVIMRKEIALGMADELKAAIDLGLDFIPIAMLFDAETMTYMLANCFIQPDIKHPQRQYTMDDAAAIGDITLKTIWELRERSVAAKERAEEIRAIRAEAQAAKEAGLPVEEPLPRIDGRIKPNIDFAILETAKRFLSYDFTRTLKRTAPQETVEEINRALTECMQVVKPIVIRNNPMLPPYRFFLLDLVTEGGVSDYVTLHETRGICDRSGAPILKPNRAKTLVTISICEVVGDYLVIEGFHYLEMLHGRIELIMSAASSKTEFLPETRLWPRRNRTDFIGNVICYGSRFRFEIPCSTTGRITLQLAQGDVRCTIEPSFGEFSRIDSAIPDSYFCSNGYLVSYAKKAITIKRETKKLHRGKEEKVLEYLSSIDREDLVRLRKLSQRTGLFSHKPIWIFRDNEMRARDSGIETFKRFSKWAHKRKYKGYFLLSKDCADYQKAKPYGPVLEPGSEDALVKMLQADVLVDTRGSISPRYVFGDDAVYLKDLCHWDYIWLIHGVMTRNESTWTNKFAVNAKLYATCGDREAEAVRLEENGYGYDHEEVQITGLPRHDGLERDNKNTLLIMPTWRKDYAGALIPGTSDREFVPNFKDCDFFKFYNDLINDERLLNCLREHGMTGAFYLHPSFIKQWADFDANDVIRVGNEPADPNKLIGECSVFVTDYSSAAFEAAYLDIPVVYAQYDHDTFGDRHTGTDGYFIYEEDGFGKVCLDLDETVEELIRIIRDNCKNAPLYQQRVSSFFKYRDRDNALRVLEEIERIPERMRAQVKGSETRPAPQNVERAGLVEARKATEGIGFDDPILASSTLFEDLLARYGVSIVENEESYWIIRGERLLAAPTDKDFVLDEVLDFAAHVSNIEVDDQGFKLGLVIESERFKPLLKLEKDHFCVRIDDIDFPVDASFEGDEQDGHLVASCLVDANSLAFKKKSDTVQFVFHDPAYEFGYSRVIRYAKLAKHESLYDQEDFSPFFSNVYSIDSDSVFMYQSYGNALGITRRASSPTDTAEARADIALAAEEAAQLKAKGEKAIVFFEKFASKYEESASVLFEKFIDEGCEDAYFILDPASDQYDRVPAKYRSHIVDKYSHKHYVLTFLADTFIATESMNHLVDLNVCNPLIRKRIDDNQYRYYFLQHGVMYMYSLRGRPGFQYGGQGFGPNSKIVVSSELEKEHFVEEGRFPEWALINSGLPKFDRATRNPDAKTILVMPTSRDFEYNLIRLSPTESTYYEFASSIIEAIPEELKERVVFVPHPLIRECFNGTPLDAYIPETWVYDDLLKQTALLITDYSSISYDAYYRGCSVIFCWEHKDMCLENLGCSLKLEEDTAFGDISTSFDDLTELVRANYLTDRRDIYSEHYKTIVEHSDGNNTQRCFDAIASEIFSQEKRRIEDVVIEGVKRLPYSGKQKRQRMLAVYYNGIPLIENIDYQVEYVSNVERGIASFVLHGMGRYEGSKTHEFGIRLDIGDCLVESVSFDDEGNALIDLSYDGKLIEQGRQFTADKIVRKDGVREIRLKGRRAYCGVAKVYLPPEDDSLSDNDD